MGFFATNTPGAFTWTNTVGATRVYCRIHGAGGAGIPSLVEISIPRWLFGTGFVVAATTTRTGSTAPSSAIPITFHYE